MERISYKLQALRTESKSLEGEYAKRIDAFQEGIKSGARELAIRHLYRAGVYWASYDNNLERNPSMIAILESLSTHIAHEYPQFNNLAFSTRTVVQDLGAIDDPVMMLRTLLRKKSPNTPGLLLANVKNEIRACDNALSRAEEVGKKLAVWKEGIRAGNNPEAICIVDMHED